MTMVAVGLCSHLFFFAGARVMGFLTRGRKGRVFKGLSMRLRQCDDCVSRGWQFVREPYDPLAHMLRLFMTCLFPHLAQGRLEFDEKQTENSY